MLRTKKADRIACAALAIMLLAATALWGLTEASQGDGSHAVGYEKRLFDQDTVHTLEITMADWDSFIANAAAEDYAPCSVTIDGERFDNVAIRAKGNTSLSSVASLGSTRYSFKVEFDHYIKGMTYHGLDKLSLNNLIQDATLMKDYLAYTLMNRMDVPAPLCSYVQITVNGEPWGLYLAVEGVEEAFRDRNGMSRGELYKPDSLSFGGGRGNGQAFDPENFREQPASDPARPEESDGSSGDSVGSPAGAADASQGQTPPNAPSRFNVAPPETNGAGFSFGMGSDDVKLIYTGDDPDDYGNIFNNAKTELTEDDRARLIEALRKLSDGEDVAGAVNQAEVIRYLAVHNFLCNDDSYTGMMVHNYYLYEENGQLSIIPWDYNLAFGGFSASDDATSTVNSPIDSPVSGGSTDSRPLISWIFSNEEALDAYHAAYSRFLAENLENGWLETEIARVQALIAPYLQTDASAFYTMPEFEQAVTTLQAFCRKRQESVRGQLDGAIPSTTQGQRENSAALVDGSDLSTADMGSMDRGNAPGGGMTAPPSMPDFPGGGGAPGGGDFAPPEGFPQGADQEADDSFGGSAGSSGESAGQRADAQPEEPPTNERPNEPEPFADALVPAQNRSGASWGQLALWSLVLLAALLIVRRAKSHND